MNGSPINYPRLRRAARDLLAAQGEPPVDVAAIAAALGAEIREFELENDVSGVLYRDGAQKVIVVNQRHSLTRQRFTIAHEIGHLALHRGVAIHVDQTFRINLRDPQSTQGQNVEEIEANAFAADLLMPAQWLRREVRAEFVDAEDSAEILAMAQRYQVSSHAMLIRLTNLLQQTRSREKPGSTDATG